MSASCRMRVWLALLWATACSRGGAAAPPDAGLSDVPPPVVAQVRDAGSAVEALPAVVQAPAPSPQVQRLHPAVQERVRAATVLIASGNSMGSGFVVAADSTSLFIVTNHHVVQAAAAAPRGPSPRVVFDSGTPNPGLRSAEVLAVDAQRDLALLRTFHSEPASVSPLFFEEDTSLESTPPGTRLYLMGFPFGLLTENQRRLPEPNLSSGPLLSRADGSTHELLVGAIANPGNSGGPAVDGHGRIAGVVTLKILDEAYSVLVSARTTRAFVEAHLPQGVKLPVPDASVPEPLTYELIPGAEARVRQAVARIVHSGRLAVVVGRSADRLLLLTPWRPSSGTGKLELEFLDGPPERTYPVTVLRDNEAGALLSIPLPSPARTPVDIRPGTDLSTGDPVWVAHASEKFAIQGASISRSHLDARGELSWLELDLPLQREVDGPLFDQRGALAGFIWGSLKKDQQTSIRPGKAFLPLAEPRVEKVELALAPDCSLRAEFRLDNPLGLPAEAGLRVVPAGEEPGFPGGVDDIVPVGPVALRQAVKGASSLTLKVKLPRCAQKTPFVQPYLLTERFHTLSLPWGLRAGGVRLLRAAGKTWRVSPRTDSDGREPATPAPPRGGKKSPRMAALAPLDPQRLYAVARAPGCQELLYDVEAPARKRCMEFPSSEFVFIRPDGRLVYKGDSEDGDTFRAWKGVPLQGAERLDNDGRRADHEILARDPCTEWGSFWMGRPYALPDGGLVFRCLPGRYSTEWGQHLDTQDADVLRFGFRGLMLMRPLGNGLAIKSPGRPARLVRGLPEDVCPTCLKATRATANGFQVALEDTSAHRLRIFELSPEGKAVPRASHPVPATPSRFFLDARGALWTLGKEGPRELGARPPPRAVGEISGIINGGVGPDLSLEEAQPLVSPELAAQDTRCHRPLKFQPDKVYALTSRYGWVEAGELGRQPSRFAQGMDGASESFNRVTISPDGRLLYEKGRGDPVRRFEADGAVWNAERRACFPKDSFEHPDPAVGGEKVCQDGSLSGFAVHPDSGALVYECTGKRHEDFLVRDGVRTDLKDLWLLRAGYQGRLLMQDAKSKKLLMLDARGQRIDVREEPWKPGSITFRASPDGFFVVQRDRTPEGVAFSGWKLRYDGSVKPLPRYPFLASNEVPQRPFVVQPDGTVVLVAASSSEGLTLARLAPGSRRVELQKGPATEVHMLVSGP